ncbi:MAG: M18 family aminopeptidase [Oceanospirillales bacterium LUC14_002_19_P2]|nr:MAG: M18 family aminopeptidase [Oceanospirillales bacterium LUC14_002_19_P2]
MTKHTFDQNTFNQKLLTFLDQSPTPFHATREIARQLDDAGFTALNERDAWQLAPGKKYYTTRNGSSIIAFTTGKGNYAEQGFRMVGAHTDSPCLKVKPNPTLQEKGCYQLSVEVYGGVLLNPWFDRDLSLAGRLTWADSQGQLHSSLIDFRDPIAIIPNLAIHLDREANNTHPVNPQKDIPPILSLLKNDEKVDFIQQLMNRLKDEEPSSQPAEILDYELFFYDTQKAAIIGMEQDFIASARLDNLLSCFTGLQALLAADSDSPCLLVCNDHEEVGSQSATGAQGPFLKNVLERIIGMGEPMTRTMQRSILISADNAHAVHPNYADKHDGNHSPIMNQGPVIKINANQRYATTSETSALFRHLCQKANVPVQSFVARTDMGCGSTIGPLTAAELGVMTLDVGLPTLAMHSIRELAGTEDATNMANLLTHFYCEENLTIL